MHNKFNPQPLLLCNAPISPYVTSEILPHATCYKISEVTYGCVAQKQSMQSELVGHKVPALVPNNFTLVGPWALGYNFFLINPPYPPSGAPCCAHAHVPAMALMLHDDSTPMHALGQDKQLPLVQHVVCCPCLLSQYCDP